MIFMLVFCKHHISSHRIGRRVKPLGVTLKNTFHLLCAFVILHQMTSLADTCRLSLEDKAIMELSRVQGFSGVIIAMIVTGAVGNNASFNS